jgi:cation diffusion facilitator family transporter
MQDDGSAQWRHDHDFSLGNTTGAERRTRAVAALTVVTMAVEIAAGQVFNSMALLADGWHMATHAAALGIAAFAYVFARRHASNRRFAFGTGKVNALAGFTSAIILALVSGLMALESVQRLVSQPAIAFDEALLVAVLGLAVNLASAWLLGGHDHSDHDDSDHHHHDHNLRAAYVHVLADALTSVLAIVALLLGKYLGWGWMDPLMGIAGAVVIARWCAGLVRNSAAVLLDHADPDGLHRAVTEALANDPGLAVVDLHVWSVGPGKQAVIVSLVTNEPRSPDFYKRLLSAIPGLAHLTVEVNRR